MSALYTSRSVGRAPARIAIDRALERADDLGCSVCIAIVDTAGHLVSYDRMDGAPYSSAKHAQDKAFSSAGNGLATQDMWKFVQHDPQLYLGTLKVEGVSVLGGGMPIRLGDELIGGVGVSGECGMSEDHAIAEAAVEASVAAMPDDEDAAQG